MTSVAFTGLFKAITKRGAFCLGDQKTPQLFLTTFGEIMIMKKLKSAGISFDLVLQHDLDELIVVQLAILVLVSLIPEFLKLFVSQSLSKSGCDRPQLLGFNESIFVLVKNLEGFLQSLNTGC